MLFKTLQHALVALAHFRLEMDVPDLADAVILSLSLSVFGMRRKRILGTLCAT